MAADIPKEGGSRPANRGNAGKGRPKGSKNKHTTLLKDAILQAAEAAGGGGEDGVKNYLLSQAIENPGPFLTLLGKVLPTQIQGDPDKPITVMSLAEAIEQRQRAIREEFGEDG